MIKRLLIAIVLLALVGGGLIGFNIFRDRAIEQFFANMPAQVLTVSTVTTEARTWTPSIDAIGTVRAAQGVELTVETAGIVEELNFSANQQVEQGALLLQLQDAMESADLEAARTQADLDRQALQRAQELQQRGVGSAVALETAQAAVSASTAQVTKLEAVLEQKQLRAPFSGTLGIPRVDAGQYLTPGTAVVTLQDVETMRADFTIPEQQLNQLRIGQPVSLTADGVEGEFKGEIIGIDPKIDPASRLVSVRAEIADTDGRLAPGQFARIKVQLPEEPDVVSLPQTAVITSLYGDHVYVVRKVSAEQAPAAEAAPAEEAPAEEATAEGEEQPAAEGEAAPAGQEQAEALEVRQVFVTVGRRNGNEVEIRDGIKAGDIVVTAGQNRLSNGTRVTVDNTINPSAEAGAQAASR